MKSLHVISFPIHFLYYLCFDHCWEVSDTPGVPSDSRHIYISCFNYIYTQGSQVAGMYCQGERYKPFNTSEIVLFLCARYCRHGSMVIWLFRHFWLLVSWPSDVKSSLWFLIHWKHTIFNTPCEGLAGTVLSLSGSSCWNPCFKTSAVLQHTLRRTTTWII